MTSKMIWTYMQEWRIGEKDTQKNTRIMLALGVWLVYLRPLEIFPSGYMCWT